MSRFRLWTRNFAAIFASSFFLFMAFMMLLPLLPVHMNRLGASDATVGTAMALFMASGLIIRPFAGIAIDHWGRRPLLLISLAAMLLFTVSYGWISVVGVIVLIRFLHGFSWAAVTTAVTTIASDQIPKPMYGMGFGVFSLAAGSALALAPLLAFRLFETRGFRLVTLAAGLMLLIALLVVPVLKYPRRARGRTPAVRGRLFEKAALIPAAAVLLSNITYGAVTGFVVLHGEAQGIAGISIYFTVGALVLMASRPLFGHLVDRIGHAKLLYPGLLSITSSLLLLGPRPDLYVLSAVLYGLGDSAAQASLNTLAITGANPDRLGAANATYFTGFDSGIGLGSLLGGVLASAFGYGPMFLIMAGLPILAGLVAAFGLRASKPAASQE